MKPTLLIDTEHNEVVLMKSPDWVTGEMGYGRNNHYRFSRNKASVWSSKRPYWHLIDPDPVVLKFGLWDAAEMRHAKDVAVVRKVDRGQTEHTEWLQVFGKGQWGPTGRLTIV